MSEEHGASESDHGHFGLPEIASISIHATIEAKYTVVEHFLDSPIAKGLSKRRVGANPPSALKPNAIGGLTPTLPAALFCFRGGDICAQEMRVLSS